MAVDKASGAAVARERKLEPTLEQLRAKDAWDCCDRYETDHINLAKGLPTLIMNSGLLQTLAFCHQKGKHHEVVAGQLRAWLAKRFPGLPPDFKAFAEHLIEGTGPADYLAITAEAFAWLKWLRQLAAARGPASERRGG